MIHENTAPRSILLTYTNWRGELTTRHVYPKSVRFGATEYHPEPQWLLLAYCTSKGADREFALKDCNFTEGE